MKNLTQKLISFALVITMSMGVATLPAFASTYPDTQSSNALSWYVSWQGTSRSITRGQSIANILASMARWLDSDAEALYNRMGGLSGDIQDVVTAIESIPGANDYSTILNTINGKIKDYTNNFASVENKLQSIVNNLINVNTGITSLINNTSSIDSTTVDISTNLSIPTTFQTLFPRRYNTGASAALSTTTFTTPIMLRWYQNSSNGSVYPHAVSSVNTVTKTSDYLGLINNNIAGLFSELWTDSSTYLISRHSGQGSADSTIYGASIADFIYIGFDDTNRMLDKLTYFLADDNAIAAKQANQPQEQNVLNNFTGSGDASASVSDFVGVKDSVSALKTSLSGGASYTQAFNILGGNSDGWSWFTTEVAESMDSTGNGSTRRSSVPVSTSYLDSYYDSIFSVIGINGGIE